MGRAIAIIRTSTIKQEIESQRKELIEFVKADGYDDDDICVFGDKGMSAIKLDDQYVENLQKVYDEIENSGNIDCVYAWALDRIGRKQTILADFRNFLIERGINLKIKNPTLSLLNSDGTVNDGMELAFSLFITLSEQEMRSKKARFHRAKNRNKADGKFNGGKITIGYAVDSEGKFVENKTTADIVRDIFNTYAYTPVSTRAIAKKYHDLGVVKGHSLKTREHYVQQILKNKTYIGEDEYHHPAIVDRQTFNSVQEKLKSYRVLPKVKYAEVPYFCQGLVFDMVQTIKEDEEGTPQMETTYSRMRVKKSECSYVSYTEKFSLNINTFDSAIVYVVNEVLSRYNYDALEQEIEEKKKQYANRIHQIKSEIGELNEKTQELHFKYYSGNTINPSTYERILKKINNDIQSLNNELRMVEDNLKLAEATSFERVDLYAVDDFTRKEIIMKYVWRIFAQKISKYTAEIDVCFNSLLDISGYGFTYDRKAKTITRYFFDKDHNPDCEVIPIPIIRQIKGRKRDYSNGKKNGKQLDVQG